MWVECKLVVLEDTMCLLEIETSKNLGWDLGEYKVGDQVCFALLPSLREFGDVMCVSM